MRNTSSEIVTEFSGEIEASSAKDNRREHAQLSRRIYIAARFDRREELRPIVRQLELAGAEVVSRWVTYDGSKLESHDLSPSGRGATSAEMDLDDLKRADLCIAFTEPMGQERGRGGRHTELGIALGLGMEVMIVGPREHVFHCLSGIAQFDSWEAASRGLGLANCRNERLLVAQAS